MSWSLRKKKESTFRTFILSEGNFFKICVLSPCTEYTFRIYILLHIKRHYFIHFCCLFLKSSKAFSVSLSSKSFATDFCFKEDLVPFVSSYYQKNISRSPAKTKRFSSDVFHEFAKFAQNLYLFNLGISILNLLLVC